VLERFCFDQEVVLSHGREAEERYDQKGTGPDGEIPGHRAPGHRAPGVCGQGVYAPGVGGPRLTPWVGEDVHCFCKIFWISRVCSSLALGRLVCRFDAKESEIFILPV